MMTNKEVVKKIRKIFTQIYSLSYACHIDSLIKIDEEEVGYNCEGCILTDTVNIKREYMLGKGMYPLCPLEMKTDIRVLK